MDKNKSLYISLVVLFCVVITGISAFFLGLQFSKQKLVDITTKNESKIINVDSYNIPTLSILYNYLRSDYNNLEEYLKNLTNSEKLYVAGLFDSSDEANNNKFSLLKENLIKTFGSDLGVLPEDYYAIAENEEPLYKYDKETDEYIYNEESPGTDAITDLDSGYIYNYILDKKESKEDLIILTYYGLYAYQDEIGPTTITNQKNIERLLNYEETFDGISDQEYLQNAFKKNKEDFLKWSYTFKKVNDNYVLVDFKQA